MSEENSMDDMDVVEEEVKKIDKGEKSDSKSGVVMQVCPICGEPELTYYRMTAGGMFLPVPDQKYLCKNCGYIGSVSLEVKSADDIEKIKKHYEMIRKSESMGHKSIHTQEQKPEVMSLGYAWLWKDMLIVTSIIIVAAIIFAIVNNIGFGITTLVQNAAISGLIVGAIIFYIHRK